jgi:hypothetical protein
MQCGILEFGEWIALKPLGERRVKKMLFEILSGKLAQKRKKMNIPIRYAEPGDSHTIAEYKTNSFKISNGEYVYKLRAGECFIECYQIVEEKLKLYEYTNRIR